MSINLKNCIVKNDIKDSETSKIVSEFLIIQKAFLLHIKSFTCKLFEYWNYGNVRSKKRLRKVK